MYEDLKLMMEDQQRQDALYKPTAFWENASNKIAAGFQEEGMEGFRAQALPLGYFVPTYGSPTNSFTREQIDHIKKSFSDFWPESKKSQITLEYYLDGAAAALGDYRVFLAGDRTEKRPLLCQFSEGQVGQPIEQFEHDGKWYSRSALNYLLGLVFIKQHIPDADYRTVLEVGGGFGSLGEILYKSETPDLRYIDIDIPPTAFAAQYYLSETLGAEQVGTHRKYKEQTSININELEAVNVLCAWQIEHLVGQIDLFVNFISFQEMEPHIVKNYLSHVDRLQTRWILLRNLRQGKQRRSAGGLGVNEPILGDDYLKMLPHFKLVAKNVHPFGHETVDEFHSELLLFERNS